MVPGHMMIETALMKEQGQLRTISEDYIETAEEAHWVQPNGNFWSFAKMLTDGVSSEDEPKTYSDFIQANFPNSDTATLVIAGDVQRAQKGLSEVMDQAQLILDSEADGKAIRNDVFNFENVLVTAQKARRNFAEAAYIVKRQDDKAESHLVEPLASFDSVLKDAQRMADILAERQMGEAEITPSV